MDALPLLDVLASPSDDQHCCWEYLEPPAPAPSPDLSISKLDPELLGYILYLASSPFTSSAPSPMSLTDVARYLAQVSRHWRAVALRYKTIWLGPALDWRAPYRWVGEVLRRSDPLPLEVVIPFEATARDPLVLSVVLMHIGRIRVLELELSPLTWWFVAESKQLDQRAPLLERLIISVDVDDTPRKRVQVAESRNIFAAHAPRLRHLQVHNCIIDLSQKIFDGLTILVIDNMQFIPIPQLLSMLRHMKLLEKLHVTRITENVLLPSNFPLSPDILEVHLLNLSELMVRTTMSVCATMMRGLVLPASCSIVIDAHNAYHEGRDVTVLLRRMQEVLSTWKCDPLTGRQSLLLGASEIVYTLQGPREDGRCHRDHPYISLSLTWHKRQTQFETLCKIFPLVAYTFSFCLMAPDAIGLLVSADVPCDVRKLLSHWLRTKKDVQAVHFQGHHTFITFEPLLRARSADDDDVVLPYMGDITFAGVNFADDARRYWRRLLKILKFRERMGSPIHEIDFVHCVGELEQREDIERRFGVMVKINGEDRSTCSSDDSDESDSDGEDSDYTVQALSDVEDF
ncbi:unnamed protein product [Cyclocybe aegerita]|uniref:F-box domain-containing protein n=1 Tax=Cyclocybe aegerita TaxID=1973307 RepID=A0A8S0VSJ3_CYCAE|nr:unnamed protein product [Cyclocybe aegerita]